MAKTDNGGTVIKRDEVRQTVARLWGETTKKADRLAGGTPVNQPDGSSVNGFLDAITDMVIAARKEADDGKD